jgi:plastocyanin
MAAALAMMATFGVAPVSAVASAAGVSIVYRAYQPATTTVGVGETVTWTNTALIPHTVTAVGGTFDSGVLESKASFSFTFLTAGSYLYTCTIHPSMKGTVIVRAAGAGAPQTVQLRLSKRREAHAIRTVLHVQAPRPGAKVLLEMFKGSGWRRVSEARLSPQGTATVSVSSAVARRLRVVVLGQPGEQDLVSRVVHSAV